MTLLDAFIYGAVQGVTEYLPISSSAHLILLPRFMRHEDPGLTFDVFLHLGTFFSTLIYFWKDWLNILRTVPGLDRRRTARVGISETGVISWKLLVIATIPALLAGAALHKLVESVFRGNAVLMTTLVIGGLLLYLCDRLASQTKRLGEASPRDALLIGIAQCFALVPGMSRSGSTMTGGRLLGFDRASAARFSFLMSMPITGAALVFELRNWERLPEGTVSAGALLIAGFSSFLFGCLAIGGLLRLLRRFGYLSFALYRVALAVVIYFVLGI